jgi:serine/threonine protein kinase
LRATLTGRRLVSTFEQREMTGEAFGNFQVVATLGKGGMGEVLLAEHQRIARRAAIKVLSPELTKDPDAVKRFFTEARATSLIHHPGIIEVFDCDTDPAGRAYIVMEYLQGETLGARLARCQRLPWPLACEIARQIAEAVGAAHRRGIIHRDLKPENVFLVDADPHAPTSSETRVKVLDFGVAKLVSLEARADGWSQSLTRDGMLLGTPRYISPEQCRGASRVDLRTDVYALGCILYEMLSGEVIFPFDRLDMLLAAHMFQPAASVKETVPDVPDWLDTLIARMLAKQPEERPSTMTEVAQALGGPVRRASADDDAPDDARASSTWGGGSPSMTMLLPPTGDGLTTGAGVWSPRRVRLLRVAAVSLAVAVLAVVVATQTGGRRSGAEAEAATETVVAQPVAKAPAAKPASPAPTPVAAPLTILPAPALAPAPAPRAEPAADVHHRAAGPSPKNPSESRDGPRTGPKTEARTEPRTEPRKERARSKAPPGGDDGIVDL